ncbi:MAG: hypothetical protein QM764_02065 [Chitinophagaceae bacterium]
MRQFIFVVAIMMALTSCLSHKSIALKNKYEDDGYSFDKKSTSDLNAKLTIALKAQNAVIKSEYQNHIIAEIKETKWQWENEQKEGAYVVLRKFKDVGANKVKKPKEVISTWDIVYNAEQQKLVIKLSNVTATYVAGTYVTDPDAGHSLGNFEKILAATIE